MKEKIKKAFLYNFVAAIIAFQVIVLFNYWLFIYRNVTQAAINDTIAYQGKIVDSNSVAPPDGEYNMRFAIYDAATAGTLLWTETWNGTDQGVSSDTVTVTDGVFTVELNSLCGSWTGGTCASNGGVDFDANSLFLQVELDVDGNDAYEEVFLPRKRFTSTAFSMNADKVDGKDVGTSGNKIPLLDAVNTWSGLQTVVPASASDKAMIIQGAESQSENLFEVQSSSGTVISAFDSKYKFY